MALPFALDGGGHFIFLSIYATLCSLCLYYVQSAKAAVRWFGLSDDFDVDTIDFSSTMALPYALADNTMESYLSITMSPVAIELSLFDVYACRHPRRQWDPGIPKHMVAPVQCPIQLTITMPLILFYTIDASVGLTPSALATVKSIFHYAHPVLSRPTVPNINVFQFNNPVQSCRWCLL